MNSVDLTQELSQIKSEAFALTPGLSSRKNLLRITVVISAVAALAVSIFSDYIPNSNAIVSSLVILMVVALGVFISDANTQMEVATEYLARTLASERYHTGSKEPDLKETTPKPSDPVKQINVEHKPGKILTGTQVPRTQNKKV